MAIIQNWEKNRRTLNSLFHPISGQPPFPLPLLSVRTLELKESSNLSRLFWSNFDIYSFYSPSCIPTMLLFLLHLRLFRLVFPISQFFGWLVCFFFFFDLFVYVDSFIYVLTYMVGLYDDRAELGFCCYNWVMNHGADWPNNRVINCFFFFWSVDLLCRIMHLFFYQLYRVRLEIYVFCSGIFVVIAWCRIGWWFGVVTCFLTKLLICTWWWAFGRIWGVQKD